LFESCNRVPSSSKYSSFGRSKGQSVVASAAYIARAKFKDDEIGQIFDYRKNKMPALATAIITPSIVPVWANEPEQLWNQVQRTEYKKNAQFARPIELNLPHQLSTDDMFKLLTDFSKQEFASQGMIAHVALHSPDRHSDNRNYHAHILLTLRRVDKQWFCGNKVREWNKKNLLQKWRENWAIACSEKLQSLSLHQEAERWRYGHLTLKKQFQKAIERGDTEYAEQACNHEPTRHKGVAICALERKGMTSYVIEDRLHETLAAEKVRHELIDQLEQKLTVLKDKIQIEEILHDFELEDDYSLERTR
jgi:hypothetical protein